MRWGGAVDIENSARFQNQPRWRELGQYDIWPMPNLTRDLWFILFYPVVLSLLIGCASKDLSEREKGAAVGGAIGAGAGAGIGTQVGGTGVGAVIGGVAGALTGGLIGDEVQNEAVKAEQAETMKYQESELERQKREIEDAKRQQYYNDELKAHQADVNRE